MLVLAWPGLPRPSAATLIVVDYWDAPLGTVHTEPPQGVQVYGVRRPKRRRRHRASKGRVGPAGSGSQGCLALPRVASRSLAAPPADHCRAGGSATQRDVALESGAYIPLVRRRDPRRRRPRRGPSASCEAAPCDGTVDLSSALYSAVGGAVTLHSLDEPSIHARGRDRRRRGGQAVS